MTVFPAPRWRKSLDKAPRLFTGSLPGFSWEGKNTGLVISPCARRPFEGRSWYRSDVILLMVKKAVVACPEDEVISLSLIPLSQEMGFVQDSPIVVGEVTNGLVFLKRPKTRRRGGILFVAHWFTSLI